MKKLILGLLLIPSVVLGQVGVTMHGDGAPRTSVNQLYQYYGSAFHRYMTKDSLDLFYTPLTRSLTINGVTQDLSTNRTWTIAAGVTAFNSRTGAITPLSTDYSSFYLPINNPNYTGELAGATASLTGIFKSGIGATHQFFNTSDQVTNFERATLAWTSNIFSITTGNGGTGTVRNINLNSGTAILAVNSTLTGGLGFIDASRSTGGTGTTLSTSGTSTASSGTPTFFGAYNTVNQTSTAGYTAIKASIFEQATGSGGKLLFDVGTNSATNNSGTHTSKAKIDNTGLLTTVGGISTTTGNFTGDLNSTNAYLSGTLGAAYVSTNGNTGTLGLGDHSAAIFRTGSALADRRAGIAHYVAGVEDFFSGTNAAHTAYNITVGGTTPLSITTGGIVNLSSLSASQAVFTDASKNLVSNAITGTGSVVMSSAIAGFAPSSTTVTTNTTQTGLTGDKTTSGNITTTTGFLKSGTGTNYVGLYPDHMEFSSGLYDSYLQWTNHTGNRTVYLPDASGTLSLNVSGSFSGVGTATTTFTVTIGATQANTTYKVNVTPTSVLSAALFYVSNKTTTTFDVVYMAGLTGTVTFDWSLFK